MKANLRKAERITIRLTPAEAQGLADLAEAWGVGVAEALRRSLTMAISNRKQEG